MNDTRFALKLKTFADFVTSIGALSTCRRRGQGAIVIASDFSEIYACGYNGQPADMPNDGCDGQPGTCGCVHAELNALLKLSHRPRRSLVMLCTESPCAMCASACVNKRSIGLVVYHAPYRIGHGLDLLARAGLPCIQFSIHDHLKEIIDAWPTT